MKVFPLHPSFKRCNGVQRFTAGFWPNGLGIHGYRDVRDPEDPEDWSFQPAASYIWSVQKWEDSNFPTDFCRFLKNMFSGNVETIRCASWLFDEFDLHHV